MNFETKHTFAVALGNGLTGATTGICIATAVDFVDLLDIADAQTLALADDVLRTEKVSENQMRAIDWKPLTLTIDQWSQSQWLH